MQAIKGTLLFFAWVIAIFVGIPLAYFAVTLGPLFALEWILHHTPRLFTFLIDGAAWYMIVTFVKVCREKA
jgi:hypothetical protein